MLLRRLINVNPTYIANYSIRRSLLLSWDTSYHRRYRLNIYFNIIKKNKITSSTPQVNKPFNAIISENDLLRRRKKNYIPYGMVVNRVTHIAMWDLYTTQKKITDTHIL